MIIDVHGHISPPESIRRFPMPPGLGDVEAMIDAKLAAGIDVTVIGSPVGAGAMVPLPGVDNYAQAEDDLDRFHDWLSGLVHRHHEHLRGYVYVNPFGGDRHLDRTRERAADPAFVGLIINSSVAGRHLYEPEAGAFFALAAELDLPVLLHAPAMPAAGQGLTDLGLIEQAGRFCDVTIGAACCILGGWPDRYPGLRIIASTAGGALALLTEKLDLAWRSPHWGPRPGAGPGPLRRAPSLPPLPQPPSSYLRSIWVDTATPSLPALALALAVFGADRVVLGTDSPPLPGSTPGSVRAAIASTAPDADVLSGILSANAIRLFGDRIVTVLNPSAGS